MAPWPPWVLWSFGAILVFWCVCRAPWPLGALPWDSLPNKLPVCRGGFALCPCGWGLLAAPQQIPHGRGSHVSSAVGSCFSNTLHAHRRMLTHHVWVPCCKCFPALCEIP